MVLGIDPGILNRDMYQDGLVELSSSPGLPGVEDTVSMCHRANATLYRVAQKVSHKVLSISLSIDRFSNFFHWRILWKICNKVITKHTTTP